MAQHAGSEDMVVHVLLVFRLETNLEIDFADVEADFDWHPQSPMG